MLQTNGLSRYSLEWVFKCDLNEPLVVKFLLQTLHKKFYKIRVQKSVATDRETYFIVNVRSRMLLEMKRLCKSLGAQHATIRSLLAVRPVVLVQIIRSDKRLAASRAEKRFFPRMVQKVNFQTVPLRKSLRANVTNVRSRPRVCFIVGFQVTLLGETGVALFTLVRFFSVVDSQVASQSVRTHKTL
jgi:hypothetical protein